jgi:peptide/nickel transport system substrate-binding protein
MYRIGTTMKGWTSPLRCAKGVKFHDGTPFDAKAVCYNFDRWYNLRATAQSANFAYYYGYFFGGFATRRTAAKAKYDSCRADREHKAVITLKKPSLL